MINVKKIFIFSTILFVVLFGSFSSVYSQESDPNKILKKFVTVMQYIRYAYVEEVDEEELIENAIIETLKELDPHSTYISAEDLQKANEPLEGSFEGIGITFQVYNDTILVITPIVGGPSETVGIRAGDKIVKIDGEKSTGEKVNNQFVFDRLRGEKGTEVDVTVFRNRMDDLIDFTIIRDKIPINSIDASFLIKPDIGYIKLTRFSKTSIEEFQDAIADLKEKGMNKLILDLRGNPGGYMMPAVELSDEFLPDKKLVVYTEGLKAPVQKFYANPGGSFEDGELIVMVNEGSASSSEIVAGAVQDWDRGIIVGRRSFGKGLVQKPFQLPDGSVIRLTTARYHTPTGRCIQRPYEDGVEDYYLDIYNRLKNGEMVNPDSIDFPDSLKYKTPKNRIVYGGGGIMPDIFIPWDSTEVTDFFVDLVRKGITNNFVLEYMDVNRESLLNKFSDVKHFKKDFEINKEMFDDFIKRAEEKDVVAEEGELDDSKRTIEYRIKALIARNLWGVSAFYEVITDIDDEFVEAVEILQNPDRYNKLSMKYNAH